MQKLGIERNEPCTLPQRSIEQFKRLCKAINIHDLVEDEADYLAGYDERQRLVDYVVEQTESDAFPLRGRALEIGSCWDGSKLDRIDEIDLLFVLEKNQIERLQDGTMRWENKEYTIREFRRFFDDCLDEVLCSKAPDDFDHGGYASPQYSGVRMNGPASTILLTKSTFTTSVDITPCFPVECPEVEAWIKRLVLKCDNRPLPTNLKPHLVACAVEEKWQISTAHIEAQLLHEVWGSVLQQAQIRNKVLLHKVDAFASNIYDKEKVKGTDEVNNANMDRNENTENAENTEENTEEQRENTDENSRKWNTICDTSQFCLVCSVLNRATMTTKQRLLLNKRLRCEHSSLPEPTNHGELYKPPLLTNNAASKHILLHYATHDDDFRKSKHSGERMFWLMQDGIREFSAASPDTHVTHSACAKTEVVLSARANTGVAHSASEKTDMGQSASAKTDVAQPARANTAVAQSASANTYMAQSARANTDVIQTARKPPDISKFSCRRTSLDDYQQMVINHRKLYSIMLEHTFTKVGIPWTLQYHLFPFHAFRMAPILPAICVSVTAM